MKILGNIHVIDFSESYGSVEFEKVAIFNANMMSDEEAIKMIEVGEYSPNILVMDKKQWVNIFCNGKEENNE